MKRVHFGGIIATALLTIVASRPIDFKYHPGYYVNVTEIQPCVWC
ncbi:MAG: hypothetical protein ACLRSA_04895 [Streptococcus salivarius]